MVNLLVEQRHIFFNDSTFKQLAQLQGAVIVAVLDNYQQIPDIYYASSWKSFNKVTGRFYLFFDLFPLHV